MTNPEILEQLTSERDVVFKRLSLIPLSKFFAKEYESRMSGETIQIGDDADEALNNVKKHQNDKTKDIAFAEKVNDVNTLNEAHIINGFIQSWTLAFQKVLGDDLGTLVCAALVSYDAYDLPGDNSLTFFGESEYPELSVPQYLASSFYEKGIKIMENVFDFSEAWPYCEDFEWTTEFIEVFFELQRLFRLNSRILLHRALAIMDENGGLGGLTQRPLYFYIAEHDMEASMLYKLN